MTDFKPLAGFIRAMRHRHYRNYTIGSVLSLIGTWTHRIALSWLTWELTASYAWLGIMAFADMFMMMLMTPLAGDLADRMDRRWVAFWSQFGMMCQAAIIACLVFLGWIEIWSLLILTMALGAMHAYHTASRLAMVPNLVPREDLTPAIAINSLIFNVARFVGPAVAGVIIASVGVGPAFTFNAMTFVIFLFVLARLEMLRSEHQPGRGRGVFLNVAEGVRYAAGHAGIGPLLVMLAVTAFAARSLPDLMPGFADGIFNRGPAGLAWLTAMMGLGAMGSGFVLLARDGVQGMTAMVTHCLVLLGIVTVVFVLMDIFWIAAVVMVAIGFTMNLNGVGVQNLMQTAVDGALRGRVMAIYTFLYQGAPAAGTLILGGIAEYTGLSWPVGAAGIFLILVWLWMVRRLGPMTATLEGAAAPAPAKEAAR
jgi:MFS family permease